MLACIACSGAVCVLWAAVDGEQKMGSKCKVLGCASGGREDRTGGQVSGFTACYSWWLSWSGEGCLAALESWLFPVKTELEGAQALQASKVLLIA